VAAAGSAIWPPFGGQAVSMVRQAVRIAAKVNFFMSSLPRLVNAHQSIVEFPRLPTLLFMKKLTNIT
jgi:hypothetical protein